MSKPEMPIFNRTFDLLTWLLPAANHFPRAHRHSFTQRLLDAAFELRERLEEANLRRGKARLERLNRADEALYHAKISGRNRIVHFGTDAPLSDVARKTLVM